MRGRGGFIDGRLGAAARQIVLVMVISSLVMAALYAASPVYYPVPDRDAGVFLYTADHLLKGEIPYRDVWDHKAPLIYFVNALGLLLDGGSRWGVWSLGVLAVSMALILGFTLMRRAFGLLPAALATLACLSSIRYLSGDANFTEVFALPLQFGAFTIFAANPSPSGRRPWFIMGLLGGAAFLLKQNVIGIWMAIWMLLCAQWVAPYSRRDAIAGLGAVSLGIMCAFAVVAACFAARGALDDLWDAAFRYNVAYSAVSVGVSGRLMAVLLGIFLTLGSGLSPLGLLAWGIGIVRLARGQLHEQAVRPVLWLALLDLPLELFLSAISGRGYSHYFIPWLPSLAILTAFAVRELFSNIRKALTRSGSSPAATNALLAGLCVVMAIPSIRLVEARYLALSHRASPEKVQSQIAVDYIIRNTSGNQTVLLWGAETSINYAAHRDAPTRFVYQYPLYTAGYSSPELVDEFLADLEHNKPALIIDAWSVTEMVPPLDPGPRAGWASSRGASYAALPDMQPVYDYIAAHYQRADTIGPQQWPVYRWVPE